MTGWPILRCLRVSLPAVLALFGIVPHIHANQVLGEVELVGASKIENSSGVWVDGRYLGYLKQLKGSKKSCCFLVRAKLRFARTDTMSFHKRSTYDRVKSKPFL